MECVGETFRHALNCLAIVAPDWLRERIHPDWVESYDHRVEDYRLPKGAAERQAYALVIGTDGVCLLNAIFAPDAPAWVCEIPAVDILRRVWIQNVLWIDQRFACRSNDQIPQLFSSSVLPMTSRLITQKTQHFLGGLQGAFHGNLR